MSKRGFNYGVKAGTLPQPIRITPMRPVWRAADIHSFIQAL
jgi:predicted DNA-binding transcriptional regulator AlpA